MDRQTQENVLPIDQNLNDYLLKQFDKMKVQEGKSFSGDLLRSLREHYIQKIVANRFVIIHYISVHVKEISLTPVQTILVDNPTSNLHNKNLKI